MDKSQAIMIAAEWRANTLRNQPSAYGDYAPADIMLDHARERILPPTEEQILAFQAWLEDELVKWLKGCFWDADNPLKGQALRIVSVDWSPDRWLTAAAEKAGIASLWFPVKTMMWISPDVVRVSVGRGGEIKEIKGNG